MRNTRVLIHIGCGKLIVTIGKLYLRSSNSEIKVMVGYKVIIEDYKGLKDQGFRIIEDIIFDNGIEVDKFAMVGIEKAEKVKAVEIETAEEITIEKADVEKLGDISAFEDFDPVTDFPLHIDKNGVENRNRARIYYGNEYWNDLLKLEA